MAGLRWTPYPYPPTPSARRDEDHQAWEIGRGKHRPPVLRLQRVERRSNSSFGGDNGGNGNGQGGSGGSNIQGGGGGNGGNGGNGQNNGSQGNNKGSFGDESKSSCSLCVADNDPRLKYSGSWVLNSSPQGHTTHSTSTPGSQVTLVFNGSAIAVFGTVPANNATVGAPTAAFTIDTSPSMNSTAPAAERDIPNQPLFASSELSSDDQHQITVTITEAPTPFTLDYFLLFPVSKTSQDTAGSSSSPSMPPLPSSPTNNKSHSSAALAKAITIVAVVFSTLVFLIILILAWLVIWRRWKIRRARYSKQNSAVRDWNLRGWNLRDTFFTSTESIMRNNPSNMGARLSRNVKIAADFGHPNPIPSPPAVSDPTPSILSPGLEKEYSPRHTSM